MVNWYIWVTDVAAVIHAANIATFLGNGTEFILKFNVVRGALNIVCQTGDRGLEVHQLGTQVWVR